MNNHATCNSITIDISTYSGKHGTRREHIEEVLEKINSLLKAHPPAGIRAVHVSLPDHADVLESEELSEELSADGWQGVDACLKTSLLEYGMCFRESETKLDVIHRCSHGNGYTMSSYDLPLDFRKEFPWVKWDEVYKDAYFLQDAWDAMSPGSRITDLEALYGCEALFGTDYAKDSHYTFLNPDNSVLFSTRDSQP